MEKEGSSQGTNIYFSAKKLPVLLVGCWLFVTVGIWLAVSDHSLNLVEIVICLLCVLFFAMISLCFLYCFLAHIPILVINEDGIQVARLLNAIYGASLTWEEITIVTADKLGGVTYFMVYTRIPPESWSAFISRQSLLCRWLFLPFVGFRPGKHRAIIRIPSWVLPSSIGPLATQLQEEYQEQNKQYRVTIR